MRHSFLTTECDPAPAEVNKNKAAFFFFFLTLCSVSYFGSESFYLFVSLLEKNEYKYLLGGQDLLPRIRVMPASLE